MTKEKVSLISTMAMIEDGRKISKEVIVESLKEAMAKAYKKNVELPDINVRVDLTSDGKFKIYQQYTVVEEVLDDELEISLEDAKKLGRDAQYGDVVEHQIKVDIDSFSRAAASLAKSVVKQKIREAEKQAIYDEYIDKLEELVTGTVETVEEKFTLVNLGKTIAILPKSQQIPNERLIEGQQVNVVITEVNRETKKSQVTVSRNSPILIKRLLEKEVYEIYKGEVEIKAIARDAGERSKVAVKSHVPEIDPIGSCVGQGGIRISKILAEINDEKIDICEWSDDINVLVKNALSPATVKAVITQPDNSILAVVDANQLSLAIGRKGKNARLVVKLVNRKIDIKTEAELSEVGIDLNELIARQEALKQEAKMEDLVEEVNEEVETIVDDTTDVTEEVVEEVVQETIEPVEETQDVTEPVKEETLTTIEEVEEPVETEKTKKRKVKLEKKADEYVSKFEKLADTTKRSDKTEPKRKKKKDEEDRKLRAKDILSNLDIEYDNRPVYSEEELEEIRLREEEEMDQYDVDYDAFEEYYDED